MERVAVLNVVGLTPRLVGEATPHLHRFAQGGRLTRIEPVLPAVTCTAQATYLTGTLPSAHGIVGNGWYDRTLSEVQFWKQSNRLVAGEKLWETVRRRRPGFTCAKLFWWYNMYSSADWSITPRPLYPADGRKVFDIHTWPYSIRTEIQRDLGPFPFPTFWGPAAGRSTPQGPPEAASRWIAESAKWIERKHRPDLSLVYLPHLDYNLQRLGVTPGSTASPAASKAGWRPEIRTDLERIDTLVGDLLTYYAQSGVRVIVLSEYGITNVTRSISLNRMFRERGWLTVKDELGRDHLDAGASRVFAVADHQVAHVYLNDPSLADEVRAMIAALPGVDQVWGPAEKRERGLDHPRAGDLIALAREDAWFDYYYWLDERRAPDFARCVDIHRKPGYDPVELFTDPALSPFGLKARVAWRLLKKRLGFRMLMDLIPLDTSLVRGSHGVCPADSADWPMLLTPAGWDAPALVAATGVRDLLLRAWEG